MIGVLRAFYSALMQLVAVIKRMLCFLHIRRRRKRSGGGGGGSILPLHGADVSLVSVGDVHTSLPSNDVRHLVTYLSSLSAVKLTDYYVYYQRSYSRGMSRKARMSENLGKVRSFLRGNFLYCQ